MQRVVLLANVFAAAIASSMKRAETNRCTAKTKQRDQKQNKQTGIMNEPQTRKTYLQANCDAEVNRSFPRDSN